MSESKTIKDLRKRLDQVLILKSQTTVLENKINQLLCDEIAKEKGLIVGQLYKISEHGKRAVTGRITRIGNHLVGADHDTVGVHVHFIGPKKGFYQARWVYGAVFVPVTESEAK